MNKSKSLIAVGVILCLLLSSLAPSILPGTARAQPADSPWPMFGQNQQRTGQSPYTGPEIPYLKWSFTTGDWVRSSPAIGADGTIYVGSWDTNLYAINPDGTEKWRFTTGSVYSSPAIGADGTIYVGSKKLYAINLDGSEKWRFVTGWHGDLISSPAIGADGTIYVGSREGNLHAINPDGSEKWRFTTGSEVRSSPAIGADGTIYVGSLDNDLYALNPDGSEKWRFTTGSEVHSSPAIGADGTIYVLSGDGNLYAINPDGSEKWRFITGWYGHLISSPAIGADGTVYVIYGSSVHALSPDGSEKWSFITRGYIESSPAIGADGTIYVGSADKNLYAINPDGSEKWRFTTGSEVHSSPAIGADGTIYVGSHDDNLYAITEPPDDYVTVSLVAPSAGATDVARTNVAFAWNALGEIDSFNFVLSANADLTDPVEIREGLASMACSSTVTLEYETTYYWQVTAWRNGVMVGQSDVGTFTIMAEPLPPPEVDVEVGVKSGDWIKSEYKITGWPAGQPYPEWLELEFLTVEGTSADVRVTMRMSDGTEESDTVPVDIVGGGAALGLSGFVIPANLMKGDTVYMTGDGNVPIEGETTRTYAGARRRVVYVSFSEHGVSLTYYWDKLTGVMVETTSTYADYLHSIEVTAKVTETNMWEPGPTRMSWWPWIIVGLVAAGLVIFFMRRRGRGSATT